MRPRETDDEPTHRPIIGAVLVAGVAVVLAVAMVDLPREGAPLPSVARYAMDVAIPKWGITEPVNEIVYGTRGFDTFGETFLLLGAVVCVITLTRRREPRQGFIGEQEAGAREQARHDAGSGGNETARQAEKAEEPGEDPTDRPVGPATPDHEPLGRPAPEAAQAMTVVVRVASRVASPILAVAGIYLVAWGYSPGGGFPAGAVMAGVILLVYAAFGYRRIARAVQPSIFETLELLGALIIIGCETLGLVLKGSFSANWIPLAEPQTIRSGGILQLFSGGEFIEVATGLVLVIFAILGMEHDWARDRQ
ncbi:MAG: hypothetical protein JO337_07000 [Acidimicrobiales bacterium]|nr:hypothetical protein [Acidimicrobiales bacterium]